LQSNNAADQQSAFLLLVAGKDKTYFTNRHTFFEAFPSYFEVNAYQVHNIKHIISNTFKFIIEKETKEYEHNSNDFKQ
jgi:hypothetical protein